MIPLVNPDSAKLSGIDTRIMDPDGNLRNIDEGLIEIPSLLSYQQPDRFMNQNTGPL